MCLKTQWFIIHGASLTTLQWFICDILCSGSSVDDPLCGQSMIDPFLESDDLKGVRKSTKLDLLRI